MRKSLALVNLTLPRGTLAALHAAAVAARCLATNRVAATEPTRVHVGATSRSLKNHVHENIIAEGADITRNWSIPVPAAELVAKSNQFGGSYRVGAS